MTVIRKKVRDGMFRRTTITVTADDSSEEARKVLARMLNVGGLDELLLDLQRQAEEILKSEGYTQAWPAVRFQIEEEEKDTPARVRDVATVLGQIIRVRACVGADKAEQAALVMWGLASAAMRAQLRPIEPLADTGQRVTNGGVKGTIERYGTEEKRAERKTEYKAEYERLHQEHPTWGHCKLAKKVGKKFGVTERAIRNHIPNTVSSRGSRKRS